MYCITLWEPWASLIAQDVKHWETRGWEYPKRYHLDRIAIHAAKRWKKDQRRATFEFIRAGLLDWPLYASNLGWEPPTLGKVLCSVTLTGQQPTEHCRARWAEDNEEFHLGDYGPRRFAWHLGNLRTLDKPFPAVGRQGFWKLSGDELLKLKQ